MIQKLRKKFILTNMFFVTTILLAVLGILYVSNYRRYYRDLNASMRQAVQEKHFTPDGSKLFQKKSEPRQFWNRNPTPMLIITFDRDGNILDTDLRRIELEEDIINELAGLSQSFTQTEGSLKDYSMLYLKQEIPEGTRIVFADLGYLNSNLRTLFINCGLIFFTCFLAFFVLSCFLARWALAPVEKAWQQQSQFVADASHELKTPLTVILANLKILVSHRSDTIENQMKWLSNTQEEANHMKQLVENLLFLARSDAQTVKPMMAEFDLSNLSWERALMFESVAFERNLTLDSEIEPGIIMKGDEGQIRRLITILLDNGCKYAGKSGTVTMRLKKEQDRIILTVHNTGDPILKEDLPHIFERFYRADKSRVRDTGGYGLGLAIAKSIAEGHKAKLTAESGESTGTLFRVIWRAS